MPKYKYADILAAVAEAAKTSKTPWDVVEYRSSRCSSWAPVCDIEDLGEYMHYDGNELRIKPQTRTINGFEVPEPVRTPLEEGTAYYVSDTGDTSLYFATEWEGDINDNIWLERGLIHLTAEPAIANTKAMLGIDPAEEDK